METVKERMKGKLSEVGKDIKESRVKQRINGIEKVDGKLTANFSVLGLPHKEKEGMYMDSYRDFQKIFDDWDALSKYAGTFLNATDDELIKICKSEY